MFKCAITGRFSAPGEKPFKLISERRERVYTVPNTPETIVLGRGWEVVKEINVTLDGLKRWTELHPEDAESQDAYVRLVKAKVRETEAKLRAGTQKDASQ